MRQNLKTPKTAQKRRFCQKNEPREKNFKKM
jgi:hypothetical protein